MYSGTKWLSNETTKNLQWTTCPNRWKTPTTTIQTGYSLIQPPVAYDGTGHNVATYLHARTDSFLLRRYSLWHSNMQFRRYLRCYAVITGFCCIVFFYSGESSVHERNCNCTQLNPSIEPSLPYWIYSENLHLYCCLYRYVVKNYLYVMKLTK